MSNFMNNLNKDSLSFSDRNFIRNENDRLMRNNKTQSSAFGLASSGFHQDIRPYSRTSPLQELHNMKPPKIEYVDYYNIISSLDDHELLVIKNIKNLCKNSQDFTFSRKNLIRGSNVTVMTADEILARLERKYNFLVKKKDRINDIDMYTVKSYALLIDKYKLVKYSRKALEKQQKEIMKYRDELLINRIVINDDLNSITVSTEMDVESAYEVYKSIDKFENIIFEHEVNELSTHVKYTTNGEKFTVGSGECTVGFAARNSSGEPGFVSAGHCLDQDNGTGVGDDVYYDGLKAGIVESTSWEDGTIADAMFVKLRDPWIGHTWLPTKNLVFGGSYDNVAINPAYFVIGTSVRFHGTFGPPDTCTVEVRYGYITAVGVSVEMYNEITNEYTWVYDQIQTDIVTYHGDSGGPLTYMMYTPIGTSYHSVMGILTGGDTTISVYSNINNIYSELNLSAY